MKYKLIFFCGVFIVKTAFAQLGPHNCYVHGEAFLTGSMPDCNTNNWVVDFSDDFDGNALDLSKWRGTYQHGDLLNGYNSQAYYSLDNVTVSGGTCKITAKSETVNKRIFDYLPDDQILDDGYTNLRSFNYTSSNIVTNKEYFEGAYEIRCRLPVEPGLWPAFWTYGGQRWNEIDIFDNAEGDKFATAITYDFNNNHNQQDGDECRISYSASDGVPDMTQWHTYTVVFGFDKIYWQIDYQTIRTQWRYTTLTGIALECGEDDLAIGTYFGLNAWPVESMSMIMDLAVGSGQGPAPAPTGATFPSTMEVDWVRHSHRTDCCGLKYFHDIIDLRLSPNTNYFNYSCGQVIVIDGDVTLPTLQNETVLAANIIVLEPGFQTDATNNSYSAYIIQPDICQVRSTSTNPLDTSFVATKYIDTQAISKVDDFAGRTDVIPNPSSGLYQLVVTKNEMTIGVKEIKVYDVMGRTVWESGASNNNIFNVDISKYPQGIYYVRCINDLSEIQIQKLIKE